MVPSEVDLWWAVPLPSSLSTPHTTQDEPECPNLVFGGIRPELVPIFIRKPTEKWVKLHLRTDLLLLVYISINRVDFVSFLVGCAFFLKNKLLMWLQG